MSAACTKLAPGKVLSGRFDIQNGGSIHCIQTPDGKRRPLDAQKLHLSYSHRVGSPWASKGKNPPLFSGFVSTGVLKKIPPLGTVKCEHYQNPGLDLQERQAWLKFRM